MYEERIRDWYSGFKEFLTNQHNLNLNDLFAVENSSRFLILMNPGSLCREQMENLKLLLEKG